MKQSTVGRNNNLVQLLEKSKKFNMGKDGETLQHDAVMSKIVKNIEIGFRYLPSPLLALLERATNSSY